MFRYIWPVLVVCSIVGGSVQGQRVAPGVPPQHYQQQHGGQPMHQQQPPQQQMQYQQQQVPVEPSYQQQPPVPHQQQQVHVPVQQQHQQHVPHQQQQQQQHHHHGNPQVLNAQNLAHERAHIAEHMAVPVDTSKMTDAELQFHYFKMHDADNNNKLDGCELIKSLIHWHVEQEGNEAHKAAHETPENHPKQKVFADDELSTLIDPILDADDANKDGFIDYPEFIRAQQKAASSERKKQK